MNKKEAKAMLIGPDETRVEFIISEEAKKEVE